VAAEFLFMEAVLVHIKSQMVLPRPLAAEGSSAEDPRDELVRRLLEYRKYKGVARPSTRWNPSGSACGRVLRRSSKGRRTEEADLSEVSLFDLLALFKGTLDRYPGEPSARDGDRTPEFSIREKMEEMLSRVEERRDAVP